MNETAQTITSLWGLTVVIEPDEEDGGYIAHCPALQGCWSQGETIDETIHNIADAISGWLAVHIERSLHLSRLQFKSEPLSLPLSLQVQIP